MFRAIVAAALIVAALAAAPASAAGSAPAGKAGCATINLGGVKIFTKQNMRCSKAKHHARRLYKTGGRDEPRNFSCSSGSDFEQGGFCEHDRKDKYFAWHPADKRKGDGVCVTAFPIDEDCVREPRKLAIGAKGGVRKINWRDWGGKRAIGFGRLTVAGFAGEPGTGIGPTRSRLKFEHRVRCGDHLEYGRLTVKYGKNFHKAYVRKIDWAFC